MSARAVESLNAFSKNHCPLPSEAIKLHLMEVGEVINLHDSESVITFRARDESL